jgi:hypothetical protein
MTRVAMKLRAGGQRQSSEAKSLMGELLPPHTHKPHELPLFADGGGGAGAVDDGVKIQQLYSYLGQ